LKTKSLFIRLIIGVCKTYIVQLEQDREYVEVDKSRFVPNWYTLDWET